jgi:hypothetical protein
MNRIRSPACQRNEAVLDEDIPERADALVCLNGGDVGPRGLLVQG